MEHYYIWFDIGRLLFFSLHYKVAVLLIRLKIALKIFQSQMYFEVFQNQISLIGYKTIKRPGKVRRR